MDDFGYDVTDHRTVDGVYGTMPDFERIVAEAHVARIPVIVDYIPNHTSFRHSWFVQARASRHNLRRDWYVWADPAPGGGPPNNWLSAFGGSVWEWDEPTGQYYLRTFLTQQPDLNWRNTAVEVEMI